jgi:glucokinase
MLRAGVDLGGTKIQAVICDQNNTVIGEYRRLTPSEGGPSDVADAIAEAVTVAAETGGASVSDIKAVGVGSPGQIDKVAGTVSQAFNLPNWEGIYSLGPALTERLGNIPAALANDVQASVLAEMELGAGRDYGSFIGVFCGTGVGGGVVIGGDLWLGRGSAGEIGHMVVKADGRRCPCGRRGCMEAYAGRGAMEARARKLMAKGTKSKLLKIMAQKEKTRMTSGVWAKALRKDDSLAESLIDEAVWALSNGIASAVNLMDVEAVIIGGGLGIRLGQPFVDAIAKSMKPHLVLEMHPPAMHLAEMGDLGGAIGASLLVKAHTPRRKDAMDTRQVHHVDPQAQGS